MQRGGASRSQRPKPFSSKVNARIPPKRTIQFNLGCYACQRDDLLEARLRVDRAIALDPSFRDAAASDPDSRRSGQPGTMPIQDEDPAGGR